MSLIQEHSIQIKAELPQDKDVSKQMEVFYNPIMISNRNISILLLNSINNKNMRIADLLAGSGIRSLRFLKELKKNKISELYINDYKENFKDTFSENLKLNKINSKNLNADDLILSSEDANLFLLNNNGFDYIDIDPFGSPNPFLAAAIARISRDGILTVTATDTAALTGTYPKVTKRKYWATTQKNYLMHELGLRILIRKVQLHGIQFDKALIPILSYHKDHYFRLYFISQSSKDLCDELIKEHNYFLFCPKCLSFKTSKYNNEQCICGNNNNNFEFFGPMWTGKLYDFNLIQKMAKENKFPEEQKFLDLLAEESKIDIIGFYDLHQLAKKLHTEPPKIELVIKKLKATRTHFSPYGIKTEKNISEVKKTIFLTQS